MSAAKQAGLPFDEKKVVLVEEYQIDINEEDSELRVVFHDDRTGASLARIMSPDEVYTFAQKLLRGYDKLEGL